MTAQESQPDRAGPYRLEERLGEGGMGVVYRALDARGREVAVKALRPGLAADETARRRLAREVETMQRVHSPFVAEILDADVSTDPPYIVTRYVSGRTLEEVVGESGPLTGQALARLACGLASALAAVHAAGVVHRDLKPGNVMLADGNPVVIDFGIAQAPEATRLTLTGLFMGTPGYLAPEVIEGKRGGPAADIHSCGATIAFAATGRAPYGGGAFETIFYRIVHGQPDLAGCPGQLLPLLSLALSRDPACRPTAADLRQRAAALDALSLVPAALPGGVPAATAGLAAGTVADIQGPAVSAAQVAPTALRAADGMPVAGSPAAVGSEAVADARTASARTRPLGLTSPGSASPGLAHGRCASGGAASGGAASGGAASGGAASWAGSGSDFADMLPPFHYPDAVPGHEPALFDGGSSLARRAAPADAARSAAPPATPRREGGGKRPRTSMLLVALLVAAAVCITIVLPVAAGAIALGLLILLRACHQAGSRLRRRRSRRGIRTVDPLMAAAMLPLTLAWSAIRFLLLSPLGLIGAGAVVAVTIIAVPAHPLPRACAFGAGTLVGFYGLGPGSRGSRQPLRGFADTIAGTIVGAVITVAVLATVCAAAISISAAHPPFFWPFGHLSTWHLSALRSLISDARSQLLRLVGRPFG